jgi:hypothetical protein
MPVAGEAFALAFQGLSVEDGLRLREECITRYIPGRDPKRFEQLLTIADLDAFLATDAAQIPRVAMADSGRNGSASVPDELFTFSDGKVDPSRLFALFDATATLIVSQFQDVHPPLARFCRGLEQVFLHSVQANIYLTPSGAQGFRSHFDSHDVLVLQVNGQKRWRVWDEQPVPFATNQTPWDGDAHKVDPAKAKELTLKPGDVLYMPRGVVHDAATQEGDEPSLHITVGLMEPTWAETLKAAIDQLIATEPALRQAFPTWRLNDEAARGKLIEQARERMALVASEKGVDLASLYFLQSLASDRMPLSGRGLIAPVPGPDDVLILADTVHHHVVPVGEGAELRWAGEAEKLTSVELGWLERLTGGATPGALGGEAALAFCRRLAKAGLLERR